MKLRFLFVVVGVVILVLVAHDVPLASHLSRVERDQIITTLERDAYSLSGQASQILLTKDDAIAITATNLLKEFAEVSDSTAIIVDENGYLLASTSATDIAGEDYKARPEIAAALAGSFRSGERLSNTLGEQLIFVAIPIVFGENVLGVVRLTYPKSTIDARVNYQIRGILIAAAVAVAMAIIAAFLLSSVVSRPLTHLRTATDRFAHGDVSAAVDEQGPVEIRELAKAFNAMAIRVKNMLDRQRSFAGDAAHQIRTPLTALRLRLEQAGDSVESAPVISREHIEAALNETDRLTNLTEQLLRLARTEGAVLDKQEIEVNKLLNELCDEWSFLAAESEIELVVETKDQLICFTNELALREIVGNYIDNAIEHSPPRARIVVIAKRLEDKIEITVRDQGPGLTAEQRARAFDRFWRGSPSRDTSSGSQGSGLGLAISAQLAIASEMKLELALTPSGTGLDAKIEIKTQ